MKFVHQNSSSATPGLYELFCHHHAINLPSEFTVLENGDDGTPMYLSVINFALIAHGTTVLVDHSLVSGNFRQVRRP